MLASKPPIKYTEMAMYIDNHIYTDDCDDNKVFLYLYHLSLMLAHKNKLFRRNEYYEDFALTFAEEMYWRLKNPKQEMLKEDGTPKMYKLKSILNYMKSSLYGRKVNFEQEKYSQSFSVNQKLKTDILTSQFSVVNQIRYSMTGFNEVELEVCLKDICKTIRNYLKNIPYANNKKEWNNIYISCLLTILNSFIFTDKDDFIIKNILNDNFHSEEHKLYNINIIQKKDANRKVILYHLKDDMENYIYILCKKIKNHLGNNFRINTYSTAIEEKNLISATIAEMENNQEKQDYID